MGVQIWRVPPGFEHPVDESGYIPGAHHEIVSDGTPVSPIFATIGELGAWLLAEGWDEERVAWIVGRGYTPSGIVRAG